MKHFETNLLLNQIRIHLKPLFLIGAFFFLSLTTTNAQEEYISLEISNGFNQDVIAEDSPTSATTTASVDGDNTGANYALMSQDYPGATVGLPSSGIFVSESTPGLQFHLTDYTTNNVLKLADTDDSDTLEFTNPLQVTQLYILATSGSGESDFTGVIYFTDNSTQAISSQEVPDWYGTNAEVALSGMGRVSRSDDAVDNNTTDPKLFQIKIDIDESNQSKEVEKIEFTKTESDGILNIFGISASFAPSCLKPTDLTLESVSEQEAQISWLSVGEETQWKVYYGENGFNPSNEEGNSSDPVSDTIYTITDLTQNTIYDVYIKSLCSDTEESNFSGPFTFTTTLEGGYCMPGTSSSSYISALSTSEAVDNIDISNTEASPNGFIDKTLSDTISQIQTIPLDFSASYTSGTFGSKIWVDWNQDGEFTEDEIVYQSSSYSSDASGSFVAPEDAVLGTTRMRIGIHYYDISGPQPCDSDSNTSFMDISFKIIPLEDCQDTPIAGTIGDNFSVCAGNAFDLNTSEASNPANGLDRVWQSSPAGEDDWTDIDGANSSTYTLTDGIDEPTDFRYKVTCNFSDETDISDVIAVSLNPSNECYCTPEGTNSSRYIQNFSTTGGMENIDNINSGFSNGGYGDFTDMTVEQVQTNEVSFSTNIEGGTAGFKIWVDWNQDGQFDTSEEVAYQSDSYSSSHSGTFTVPVDAIPGETRMRIVSHWLSTIGAVDPCETGFTYGEFEDYIFNVVALEDCEGTPSAGTVDEDFSVCAGNAFNLNTSGASVPATGLERIWQSSPAGEDTWTDLDGASANDYILEEGIQEPTDFRYTLICNNSGEADTSDVVSVTLNPAVECYCTPEDTSTGFYYINEVLTNNALQNLDKNSDYSGNGYADYTETDTLIVYPGQEFNFSISGSSPYIAYKGWVDSNQDGQFDNDQEVVFDSNGTTDTPFTGTYTVPSAINEGFYRLRVRGVYFGSNIDPCGDADGETEDYMVKVVIPECFPPTDITINYITDNSAQVNWMANGETSWKITYGLEGFDMDDQDAGTSVTVDGDPQVDILDLETNSTYDVYINALCEANTESVLLEPDTFTTKVTPPENTRLCDAIELIPNAACSAGTYTTENAFEQVGEPVGSCYNNYHGTNSVWFTFEALNTTATIDTDYSSTEIITEISVYQAPTNCEDLTTLGEQIGCATAEDDELILHDLIIGDIYYVRVAGFNNMTGSFCINLDMQEQSCDTPTNITVDVIDDSSVNITWNPGGDESEWEVLYGQHGFDPENEEGESQLVSNTAETILEGLEADTQYDVYVHAICNETTQSNWAGPKSFNTPLNVDKQIFEGFTFYPNPVKGQLTLKANAPIKSVTLFNLLGQTVITEMPYQLQAQLNTDALQSGVYLMKVNINNSTKNFKIVKE